MSRSMTGFGAGRASSGGEEISVELRAVNHKFLEVKPRLPRELSTLEAPLVKQVKDRLSRGAVELTVRRSVPASGETVPRVNAALAVAYRDALAELSRALGTGDKPTLRDVANQPGVLVLDERGVDLEGAQKASAEALEQALAALVAMREIEGQTIAADIAGRLSRVKRVVEELVQLAPAAVAEYQKRLEERIAELTKAGTVDPQRLAQEVAIFAERTDVAEELTRLESHLSQFDALLASQEPAGRKMDFLVQELHREVNTTGSKSQNAEISARIVELKAELERIREQVQNVE